jgi:hypothetical protein
VTGLEHNALLCCVTLSVFALMSAVFCVKTRVEEDRLKDRRYHPNHSGLSIRLRTRSRTILGHTGSRALPPKSRAAACLLTISEECWRLHSVNIGFQPINARFNEDPSVSSFFAVKRSAQFFRHSHETGHILHRKGSQL